LSVLYTAIGKICDVASDEIVGAYLVQRPGRAEYLSGEHDETNWCDEEEMERELRCLEKNKRYPGAKAAAHCKLAPNSKRHRSFAGPAELNAIAGISISFRRLLAHTQRQCDHIVFMEKV
jgi:hypothetical protein